MSEHRLDDACESRPDIIGDAFAISLVGDVVEPMGVVSGPIFEIDNLVSLTVRSDEDPSFRFSVPWSALTVWPGHGRFEAPACNLRVPHAAKLFRPAGAGVCGPCVMYVDMGLLFALGAALF